MAGAGKKVEVRFGAFSCSIEGYDDPVQQMREVLLMMQQMMRETPALVDHGPNFGDDELARIEDALDRQAGAGDPGRIVIRGGRNGEDAEDAVTTAEIAPERGRHAPETGEGEDAPAGRPEPASDGAADEFSPTAAAGVAPVVPEAGRSGDDGGGDPERPFGDGTGAEASEAGLYAAPVAEVGDADFAGAGDAFERRQDVLGEASPEGDAALTASVEDTDLTAGDRAEHGPEGPQGSGEEPETEPGVADGENRAAPEASGESVASAISEDRTADAAEAGAEERQPESAASAGSDAVPATNAAEADRETGEATRWKDSAAGTATEDGETAGGPTAGEPVLQPDEEPGARSGGMPAEDRQQAVNIFAPPPVAPGSVAAGAAGERGPTAGAEGVLAPSDADGSEDVPAPDADGAVDRDVIAPEPAAATPAVVNIFAPPEPGGEDARPELARGRGVAEETTGARGEPGAYARTSAGTGAAAPDKDAWRTAGADADVRAERRGGSILLRPSMPLFRGADARAQTAPATAAAARRSVNIFGPRREGPTGSGLGERSRGAGGGHAGELWRAGGLGPQGAEPREPERPPAEKRERGISGLLSRLTGGRAPDSD